jgi:hypothetical protein
MSLPALIGSLHHLPSAHQSHRLQGAPAICRPLHKAVATVDEDASLVWATGLLEKRG